MRFKKVLLVNPPKVDQGGYKPSPLGILYLASYLRKHCPKVKVKVIDGAIEGEGAVLRAISTFNPDLVGASSLTPGRHQALWVIRKAKHIIPQCKTVLGNVHPTIMWKQMMEHYDEIDFIIRGEGEEALFELVVGQPLLSIGNLVWRDKAKIVNNRTKPMITDIDSIPFPAWDLVNPKRYPPRGSGYENGIDLSQEVRFPLIFSRGCMGACTFCSSWMIWKGYRYRKGRMVADEIQMLYDKYHARHFVFQDDTLTGNREEIISFSKEIIKRKLNVAIYGTTRADKVDRELLKFMKLAGFYELSYGIESGSPGMLIRINKRTELKDNLYAVQITKKAGIKANALIMHGLPGETKKDRLLTESYLRTVKPDETGTVGAVWIFPGTALYEQAKHAKLIGDSFWLTKKAYYIYRGGIGKDKVNIMLRLRDELWHLFGKSMLWKTADKLNSYKEKLQNKVFTKLNLLRTISI